MKSTIFAFTVLVGYLQSLNLVHKHWVFLSCNVKWSMIICKVVYRIPIVNFMIYKVNILTSGWCNVRSLAILSCFLAHLSQRLKWAIVIAHRPSSVRPSSVRPSVVRRPSVNFHIFNFFSRTAWWIVMKLGRDEVLMVPYKCCCFSDRSAQGRIQGGAKIGHRGSTSSRIFFFRPEGYSNKPNG